MKLGHNQNALPAANGPRRRPPGNSGSRSPMAGNEWKKIFGICVFLVVIVWIVFGQTCWFPFVDFDDEIYVYQNSAVMHGLTARGIVSAFHVHNMDNWIPLTT